MLPNDIDPVSPFDIILSETTNQIIENIESLSDGSGIAADAISTSNLDNGAVTGVKLDITTGMGTITNTSDSLTTSWASYGTNLNLDIPSGCNYVMVLGSVRINNQANVLGDQTAAILYDNTTRYLEVTITNSTTFNGSSIPIVGFIPVTSGTKNFRLQGVRGGTSGSILSEARIRIIPLV